MSDDTATSPSITLAQRLTEGKIPVTDALRYAMILGDTLRRMHDNGRVHGEVAPCHIVMTSTGVELEASRPTALAAPYEAPEVLQGQPADARSDIFSFAAVLYEMLTGRPPYQGKDRATPMPSGSPAVDRLVAACLALEPSARPQRMQKVMLDLKLLAVAAARAKAPAAASRAAADAGEAIRAEMAAMEARLLARLQTQEKKSAELIKAATDALNQPADEGPDVHAEMLQMEGRMAARLQGFDKKMADLQRTTAEALYREPQPPSVDPAELQQMEARITSRLQAGEQAKAEIERVAGEAVSTLREQFSTIGNQLVAAQERAARAEQSITRLEAKIATLEQRDPTGESSRVEVVEQSLGAVRKQTTELRDLVADDMLRFEQSLKTQSAAIESARTAMAQTDDLVERVVEALESLQNTVLDHNEERALAVN